MDDFPVCKHCGCVWANCNDDELGVIGCPVAGWPERVRLDPTWPDDGPMTMGKSDD